MLLLILDWEGEVFAGKILSITLIHLKIWLLLPLCLFLSHVKMHSIVRFKCSQRIYYRAGGENNYRQWHFGVGIFAMFFFFSSVSRCKANGVRNKFLFCGFCFNLKSTRFVRGTLVVWKKKLCANSSLDLNKNRFFFCCVALCEFLFFV